MRLGQFLPPRPRAARAVSAVAFLLAVALTAGIFAADEPASSEAAKQQYSAAVTLQNKGLYDLAADQWAAWLPQAVIIFPARQIISSPIQALLLAASV